MRLVPRPNGERRYEILIRDAWRAVYDLAAEPPLDVDLEAANWFTSTHPSSVFKDTLMVTRTTDAARYVLVDGQLTVRRPNGAAWEPHILDADALEACLKRDFGLSPQPSWRGLIERAAAASLAT